MTMKSLKITLQAAVLSSALFYSTALLAADSGKPSDAKNLKAYPLKTCVVSGEKLEGDMGKPYVFSRDGQEIKLCCKDCLKDFNKAPAKYMKKIAEAQKEPKDKDKAGAADHGAASHS